jgi:hypothetical protein
MRLSNMPSIYLPLEFLRDKFSDLRFKSLEYLPSSKYWDGLARLLYGLESGQSEVTKQAEAATPPRK